MEHGLNGGKGKPGGRDGLCKGPVVRRSLAWLESGGATHADAPDTSPFTPLAFPEGLGFQEFASTQLGVSYMSSPLCNHLISFSKEHCVVASVIIISC